ncbi:MAG: carboxypeptidase regulatory-like domain-containing protein [Anaerolineae bacterium]|nr:carboxypeptidase regulatory-like domain-containing protein [Anaerolineae bacterium]
MQRNIIWIILGILFGCLILLAVMWFLWRFLFSPPLPVSPTSMSGFVTMTSASTGSTAEISPTLTLVPATLIPTATVVPTFPPTATPIPTGTPTPVVYTPTPPLSPHAVINGPNGYVNVRSGPGLDYIPLLGTYNNGTVVDIFGKQYSSDETLWWFVPFPIGTNGRGWVYADYTIARNVGTVPWVNAPSTPTPVYVTPTPIPTPHAIINSPDGFLYVRSGPGSVYQPTLGAYNNGAVVDIIGKQVAANGALWWLIPFASSPNRQGWIYANYTIAKNTNSVPWVPVPPTPTPAITLTPTPTSTPIAPLIVTWNISGRVIDRASRQPVVGAGVAARLGNDGTQLTTITDGNGNFYLAGQAHDDGNLWLTITAAGYSQETLTAGAVKPRVYNFPAIELTSQEPPLVSWVVFGRVVEIGTANPVPNVNVEAILGTDGVRLNTLTGLDGEFSLNGQARDRGSLSLTITATDYQTLVLTPEPTDGRVYHLADLPLVPVAGSCAYESVINLSQIVALSRLQSLSFTNVTTTSVNVGNNQNLVGLVLTQSPDPPPEGQSERLNCQLPIILGIGVGQ